MDEYQGEADWMRITVTIPPRDGDLLMKILRVSFNFQEVDWCEMQRPDRARVVYGPCPPLFDSGLTVDPFPPKEAHP
jgi:hypothetical protein